MVATTIFNTIKFLFPGRWHGRIVSVFAMVLEKQTFFFKNMVVYGMEGDLGIFQTPPSHTIALTMDFFGGLFYGSPRNKSQKYDHAFSTHGSKWQYYYHNVRYFEKMGASINMVIREVFTFFRFLYHTPLPQRSEKNRVYYHVVINFHHRFLKMGVKSGFGDYGSIFITMIFATI